MEKKYDYFFYNIVHYLGIFNKDGNPLNMYTMNWKRKFIHKILVIIFAIHKYLIKLL